MFVHMWDCCTTQGEPSQEVVQEKQNKTQDEEKRRALTGGSRSALDPIQLMVQVVDIKTRQKSRYMQVKLHALLVLRLVAKVGPMEPDHHAGRHPCHSLSKPLPHVACVVPCT